MLPLLWACAASGGPQSSTGYPVAAHFTPQARVVSQTEAGKTLPSGRGVLIKRLKAVETADLMNSQSYSDTNATLDSAYYFKAREIRRVIERIESRQQVSQEEIDRALDNSAPYQLGGYPR